MANAQGNGDLAVYTLDGSSQLTTIKNVAYEFTADKGDTTTINRPGSRRQTVRKGCTIKSGFMSTLSGDSGMVASNLAISAFSLGGQSYLSYLRGGSFRGSFTVREVPGVGDVFRWPQIFGKDYKMEVTLVIPAAGDSQLPNFARSQGANLHDTDLNDQDLTRLAVSITIDGVTTALTMEVDSMTHTVNQQQEQVITLSLSGNDPGTGAYPTTPTGTTTLFEKMLNAHNTVLAVVLTTAAAGSGQTYSGNFIFTDFGFSFNDSEIIMIDYTLSSRGPIASANA